MYHLFFNRHLAKELSAPSQTKEDVKSNALPALVIVTSGGEVTKKEVLQAVRLNMRLVIIEGSGGFADEIVQALKKKPELPDDPDFAEIIEEGDLFIFNVESPVKAMEYLIVREQGVDKVLANALNIYSLYDANAVRQQKKFLSLQNWIIILGLVSTALVIFQQVYGPSDQYNASGKQSADELLKNASDSVAQTALDTAQKYSTDTSQIAKSITPEQKKLQQQDSTRIADSTRQAVGAASIRNTDTLTAQQRAHAFGFQWKLWKEPGFYWWLLHLILIAIPIIVALLIAAANKFKQGNKWIKLRAGAEKIKEEIYRYRTRSGVYLVDAEEKLAEILNTITHKTMDSEVSSSSLKPYKKDEVWQTAQLSHLSPEKYIEERLNDQLHYFTRKAVVLERKVTTLFWMQFAIAGLGSFLAATNMQIWVALTGAMVAAIISYLGYQQTAANLLKYNLAATDLWNIKSWWNALSGLKKADPKQIDELVNKTETVLRNDMDSWSNRMSASIKELNKQQEKNKIDGLSESQNEQNNDRANVENQENQENLPLQVVAPIAMEKKEDKIETTDNSSQTGFNLDPNGPAPTDVAGSPIKPLTSDDENSSAKKEELGLGTSETETPPGITSEGDGSGEASVTENADTKGAGEEADPSDGKNEDNEEESDDETKPTGK